MDAADEPKSGATSRRGRRPASGVLSAGTITWQNRVTQICGEYPGGRPAFAALHGLGEATLQSWATHRVGPPATETMYALHASGAYLMADQVMDLFGLGVHELAPTVETWQPKYAYNDVMRDLVGVLSKSRQLAPTIHDFTERLLESCQRSGDIGRWRTRHFDVPMGWLFPHLGYQGVEFLRWNGPNRMVDRYPGRSAAYVQGLLERGQITQGALDKLVSKKVQSLEAPQGFRPSIVDEERRASEWLEYRANRYELMARLSSTIRASSAAFTGGFGVQHAPLLRHGGDPTGRYMYVVSAPRPAPRPDVVIPLAGVPPQTRVIVFLAPTSLRMPVIAKHVAEALSWPCDTNRSFAARLYGHRPSLLSDPGEDLNRRICARIAAQAPPIDERTVLAFNFEYLHRKGPDGMVVHPEVLAMLSREWVFPVLMTHPDESEPNSSTLWELRQWAGDSLPGSNPGGGGIKVMRANDAGAVATDMNAWRLRMTSGGFGGVEASILQTFLHAGGATGVQSAGDHPAFFRHPQVGDLDLRAAYEIAIRLAQGGEPMGRTFGFAPDSLVQQFSPLLSRITGGSGSRPTFWSDPPGWTDWDPAAEETWSAEVHGVPPRTRVVRFTSYA